MTKFLRRYICMMATVIVTACSAQPDVSPPAATTAEFNANAMTEDITALVDRYAAPGLAVAVISDGRIIYDQGFGFADIDAQRPVDAQTQFGIGSVAKSFTSGMIGTLQADDMVALDERPGKYVEGLAFKDRDLSENLTLQSLLTQTSGLPFMDGSTAFFPARQQGDMAPRLKHFPASCRVGDCWTYNNMNFAMLDMVAEAVSGESKSDLLRDRLLLPIGMADSLSTTAQMRQSAHAAVPYGMVAGAAHPVAFEEFYGEHIYATAPDMARWIGMWMNGGLVDGTQVVPADYVTQAMTMQAISDGAPPEPSSPQVYMHGYGYGWMMKSVEGHYVVHHGGNENGFSTHVLFVPAENFGIVALTNQQNSILPNIVTDAIFRRWLDLPETPSAEYPVIVTDITPPMKRSEAAVDLQVYQPPSFALDGLTGTYRADGFGQVVINYADDILTLTSPLGEFILKHDGENIFQMGTLTSIPAGVNIDFFRVEFLSSKALTMNIGAAPVTFRKTGQ